MRVSRNTGEICPRFKWSKYGLARLPTQSSVNGPPSLRFTSRVNSSVDATFSCQVSVLKCSSAFDPSVTLTIILPFCSAPKRRARGSVD